MTLILEKNFEKISNVYVRLFAGGIVVSVLVYLFPAFYGEGYTAVLQLLQEGIDPVMSQSIFYNLSDKFWVVVVFMASLVFLKVFASSATN